LATVFFAVFGAAFFFVVLVGIFTLLV